MPKKYQNKSEVVVEIPLDYAYRVDFSTRAPITSYLTDEATNDVDGLRSEDVPGWGYLDFTSYNVTTNYPEYIRDADGLPCLHFQDDGCLVANTLLTQNPAIHAAFDDATTHTQFLVIKHNDPANESTGNALSYNGFNKFWVATAGLDDSLDLYVNTAFRTSANNWDDRKFIATMRNSHIGVDDNDTDAWIGQDSIHTATTQTDASLAGPNLLGYGSYNFGGVWDIDCNVYEHIAYPRALSNGEVKAVIDYLSAKWNVTNEDSNTKVVSEPLNTFPQDYWERWDATTSSGMGFVTDEATGDCEGWLGEAGNVWLVDSPGTNYPVWTPGKMTFAGSGDKALYTPVVTGVFSGNPRAVFCAGQLNTASPANGSFFAGPTAYIRFEDLTDEMNFAYNDGTANNDAPTNSLIDSPIAVGYSTDMTDINWWWGGNSKHTATVSGGSFNEALANLYVGMANASATTTMDGELYEVIVYDRHVTDAEAEQILAYLSAKWQAQNEDSASSVIATYDGLGHTWKSDGPDPQGLQLEGFTPVNHTVTPLRNADAPRIQNLLPEDYVGRWDATTSDGMTFTTSEAVGDIATWVDETGTYTFDDALTNDPVWNPGEVYFDGDSGLLEVISAYNADDMTVIFCGGQIDGVSGYDYILNTPFEAFAGNQGGTDEKIAFVMNSAGSPIYKTTNDLTTVPLVLALTNTHNGVDDNDKAAYLGNTLLGTSLANSDVLSDDNTLAVGYNTATSNAATGYMYELVVYDRVLSAPELAGAIDYLSHKWQAQNEDSATTSVSTASTGRDQNFDDNRYPANTWGSLLKFHFDAAQSGDMTFDTGDATSGGTVSSWTDLTGTQTMTTAISGDSAVTWLPNHKGHPAIQGGTVGSPKSLKDNTVSYSTTAGHQRLFWQVVDWDTTTLNAAPCGPAGLSFWAATFANYNGDMPTNPPAVYNAVGAGRPVTVRDASEGITIIVWRQTKDAGATGDLEVWYCGHKIRTSTAVAWAGNTGCSVGALEGSTYDAEGGRCFEMGAVNGNGTAITDADVEGLIQYLCNKYGEDYMPATTPMDIGLSRSTSTIAQTDTCLWHEPSTMTPTAWDLHPKCAAYHTTPANFAISPPTGAVPLEKRTGTLGKPTFRSTEGMTQFMESDNSYTSTETTDFPADTLGMSTFGVMRLDPATVAASGARTGNGICHVRFSGTSDTTLQVLASNVSKNWAKANDWIIIGNSYAYDDDGTGTEGYPGATDGGPGAYYYCNDETVLTAATPAATSYTVENWVNWDVSDGVAHMSEIVVFKHPLTIEEINELKKYFQYKYNYLFDT